ncbi:MAG: molybdate ABC transporter substrate-binding protein [Burkholderiales bacterium]|nr:molybdate ABC transporter substrate-binding protein [Burkholderiales bacterium]
MKVAQCLMAVLGAVWVMAQASAAEITVSAAASLTDAFKIIAQNYEKRYPDAKVALNFGASGALLQQMEKGAPVDVFASADQKTMDQAATSKLIDTNSRVNFVKNTLVLIAPIDSALKTAKLEELNAEIIKRVSLGNPDTTPAGRYAQRAMEAANLYPAITPKLITTQNVRQSLDYVARGEVDVGFVFATDAAVSKDKVKVLFTVPMNEVIHYPIAVTADALTQEKKAAEAKRFVEYILSDEGSATLATFGFTKP